MERIRSREMLSILYFTIFLATTGRTTLAFSAYKSSIPSLSLHSDTSYKSSRTRLFASSAVDEEKTQSHGVKYVFELPGKAVKIYTDYVKLLWSETSTAARAKITKDKQSCALSDAQHLIKEYIDTSPGGKNCSVESRQKLLQVCEVMADEIQKTELEKNNNSKNATLTSLDLLSMEAADKSEKKTEVSKKTKKKSRSVLFGAMMGLCAAGWVFSGNLIYTGIFTSMCILGQLEYYRMVMNTGVYPARKISVIGGASCFLTALFAPNLHQICLPMFGLWTMVWFLTMKRKPTTIPEIATTFTGMFYLGYVPSFWIRVRSFGAELLEPTKLASLTGPMLNFLGRKADRLPSFIPKSIHYPVTTGSVFIFWTWLCIAFSDVGAYFVGRKYGKTKLGELFPAAGATSPNKSLEGYLGGSVVSAGLGVIGAWVQKWPYWLITGALHGTLVALLGLIGDLTASMLKRDAGLKDFGNIIPEHGGIMDRVDSFVWTAPYSYLVCVYFIPFLRKLTGA